MTVLEHALYGAVWIAFGVFHSILAAESVKRAAAPVLGRAYRLVYNALALVLTLAILWFGEAALGAGAPVVIDEAWIAPRVAIMALGAAVLLWGAAGYDRARFLGLAQLRDPSRDDDSEALHVTGPNRYMRHPLYTGAMLFLWGRASTEPEFATAAWISLYFIVGARFEEKRLLARFGQPYRDYCARTAAFLPGLRWLR
ncbi:MAG: isoprenylcysteine carboxylmethyltransferase family protein [Alphaproteobacteria bacterium]|nr:isoprenylcysteine carboxylmethyltransferase family protein [Alphaproteobacteria bacterium]